MRASSSPWDWLLNAASIWGIVTSLRQPQHCCTGARISSRFEALLGPRWVLASHGVGACVCPRCLGAGGAKSIMPEEEFFNT